MKLNSNQCDSLCYVVRVVDRRAYRAIPVAKKEKNKAHLGTLCQPRQITVWCLLPSCLRTSTSQWPAPKVLSDECRTDG